VTDNEEVVSGRLSCCRQTGFGRIRAQLCSYVPIQLTRCRCGCVSKQKAKRETFLLGAVKPLHGAVRDRTRARTTSLIKW